MDDMLLEFMLQDKSVAADVAMKPEQETTCEKCGQYALLWNFTVTRVYEGREEIALDSELGRAITAYVLDKVQHMKPICQECLQQVMEKEFPN